MALLMAGMVAVGTAVPANAAEQEKEDKVETVYVNAAADGKTEQVTVSEWLKSDGKSGDLKDYTNLTNIKNVKGEEEFTQKKDGSVIWKSEGKDIYYQGESEEELPVSMKVTYYLDGKKINPDQLAGKSGKVKIRFDYYNHSVDTVKVDGEKISVQTPFTMVTTMILPSDIFTNIEVTNGKVVSDGDKNIVVGLAFPGLKDSLKLGSYDKLEDISIPDSFEVTADAEKFELALTATAATTGNLDSIDTGDIEDAGDLKENIDQLTDASTQLVKGTGDLLSGMNTLSSSFGTYTKGVKATDKGAKELKKGLKTLNDNKDALKKGADSLSDGLTSLKNGTETLNSGIGSYTAGVTSLEEGIQSAGAGTAELQKGAKILSKGLEDYTQGAANLSEGIQQLESSLSKVSLPDQDTLNQVSEASKALASDAAALQKQLGNLQGTIKQLESLKSDLQKYQNQVANQLGKVKEELGKVDAKATGQAREQAKKVLNVEGLTEEQKEAIQSQIQGIEISGVASEAANALSNMPSMNLPDISVDVSGLSSILEDMNTQAAVLKSFAGNLSGLTGQIPQLTEAVKQLASGAKTLTANNSQLIAGMKQLSAGIDTLSTGLGKLEQGAGELSKNNKSLTEGAKSVKDGATKLESGSKELKSGIKEFNSGVGQLDEGAGELASGTDKLNGASNQLTAGVDQLTSGAGTLNSGMKEFDEEGIQQLKDLAGDDLENVINHFKAVKKADQNYNSFAGIHKDASGSVKFLIETAPITVE